MKDAVVFRELEILRAPGFPRGGPVLRELSPGINLVPGPNTSGKSTAARAIQQALWQQGAGSDGAESRVALIGRFEVGEDTWRVEVDGGRRRIQMNGRDAAPPALPPSSARSRYRLSLQDLFTGDDRDLAESIRRESVGGFDIPSAAEALGFGAGGAKQLQTRAYTAALKAVEEARAAARLTREDRDRLDDLRRELKAAEYQAGRVGALELARELAEARAAHVEAARRMQDFPEELGGLRGTEGEELDRLEATGRTLRDELREAERKVRDAQERLDALGLGPDGVPGSVISDLDAKAERIGKLEHQLADARSELAEADARVRAARAESGMDAPDAGGRLAELGDAELLGRLDDMLREAASMRHALAEVDAAVGRLSTAEEESAGTAGERDRIEVELRLLREWLRSAPARSGGDRGVRGPLAWALLALGGTGLAGVVAGLLVSSPAGMIVGIVAIVAAVVLALVATRRGAATDRDERAEVEERAAQEGVGLDTWSVESVRSRVTDLERAAAASREGEYRRQRLDELLAQRESLRTQADDLAMRQAEVAAELGFGPGVRDLSLHVLGTRLVAAEAARSAAEAARGRVAELQDRIASTLAAARALTEPFGHAPEDGSALRATLSELRGAREAHAAATRDLQEATRSVESGRARAEELERDRTALIERVFGSGNGVGEGAGGGGAVPDPDEAERRIRELAARLDEWREARAELESLQRDVRRIETELGDALDDDGIPSGPSELDDALDRARTARDRVISLKQEEAKIEQILRDARKSHDLERALESLDAARRELATQRETDIRDAVGAVLADHVRSTTVDRNRPRVFERATEILGRITRGRYTLDLSDTEGSFRAIDSVDGVGRSLEELSAGTRIQVLLAVRIAFVETQESGVAAPLLLDEVLANCDDIRAQAIIEAMIELARGGRQILYFTAQSDELTRWRRALEDSGVEWAECGLGGAESFEEDAEAGFSWADSRIRADVPEPAGRDHAAYGRELEVPRWNPRDSHRAVHPWYLIEDVQALHGVLTAGIFTWGSLDAFVRHAGSAVDDIVASAHLAAEPWARVVRRFTELWRLGRGTPVTRETLIESGAVSDTFLDDVTDLAARLDGDARELLDALRAREISRWQTAKSDELEDYLSRTGHLDGRPRLGQAEIRTRLVELVGELPPGTGPVDIDRFVRRLARGPSPAETGEAS